MTQADGTPAYLHRLGRRPGRLSPGDVVVVGSAGPAAAGPGRPGRAARRVLLPARPGSRPPRPRPGEAPRPGPVGRGSIRRPDYCDFPGGEKRSMLARGLVRRFGAAAFAVPGLVVKAGDRGRYPTVAAGDGLLVPVRDPAGRIVAIKVRSADPAGSGAKYYYLSSAKEDWPGPGPGDPLHVPLGTDLAGASTCASPKGRSRPTSAPSWTPCRPWRCRPARPSRASWRCSAACRASPRCGSRWTPTSAPTRPSPGPSCGCSTKSAGSAGGPCWRSGTGSSARGSTTRWWPGPRSWSSTKSSPGGSRPKPSRRPGPSRGSHGETPAARERSRRPRLAAARAGRGEPGRRRPAAAPRPGRPGRTGRPVPRPRPAPRRPAAPPPAPRRLVPVGRGGLARAAGRRPAGGRRPVGRAGLRRRRGRAPGRVGRQGQVAGRPQGVVRPRRQRPAGRRRPAPCSRPPSSPRRGSTGRPARTSATACSPATASSTCRPGRPAGPTP